MIISGMSILYPSSSNITLYTPVMGSMQVPQGDRHLVELLSTCRADYKYTRSQGYKPGLRA